MLFLSDQRCQASSARSVCGDGQRRETTGLANLAHDSRRYPASAPNPPFNRRMDSPAGRLRAAPYYQSTCPSVRGIGTGLSKGKPRPAGWAPVLPHGRIRSNTSNDLEHLQGRRLRRLERGIAEVPRLGSFGSPPKTPVSSWAALRPYRRMGCRSTADV